MTNSNSELQERLLNILKRFPAQKIAIIGDAVWWPSRLAKGRTEPEPERELERV